MWHGSVPAPGGIQVKGWLNVTGDVNKIMNEEDFRELDKIYEEVHLDYPQLMHTVSYVNELVEQEISGGIPAKRIIISGYSSGALSKATAMQNSKLIKVWGMVGKMKM
ncbi:4626_t:CDS:2 [Paraglomus brasilianum]|uniref:4626_t:CDS:1 n=1 Tax=Paraglomus brasilianum TaxID=144538 RepID=A0A9N9GTY3_9GLOM|nr:4626_t:CDS:2 [Paraglomus brasilianum]